MSFSRNNNNLIVTYSGRTVTINDFFNANGSVASSVRTIRVYDNSEKRRFKDYNLVTSGLLNSIDSGVEDFVIKKGVITGTTFADTISAENYNTPTGKSKDIGVTINTGLGDDNITGSKYKDTFNITGSGTKTINIKATDDDDIIKGINTKNSSLVLNLSNTVLDTSTNAANNATYERVGNDLKITASETVPTKINDLTGYVWIKEYNYAKGAYEYTITTSDNPAYNYYWYSPNSFATKPLYSYQEEGETKCTDYREITNSLADTYLLVGYNAYDGRNDTPEGSFIKLFTSEEAALAFKDNYYDEDEDQPYGEGHDTCEITKLSDLEENGEGKKILYSYVKCAANSYYNTQVYSKNAPAESEPIPYSNMYLHKTGTAWVWHYDRSLDCFSLVTEENKVEGDIKISDLEGSIYYREDGNFYVENPFYNYYTEIPASNFDTTYYLSNELFFVSDYQEYDVENSYYRYNEQNYYYTENQAPTEIGGYCTLTDTEAPEYTAIDTIYSYVNDGSMAYTFDANTANYQEGTESPASSTTTIKDYFKNPIAPDVEIGLKGVNLIDALNKTDLVNIDRQYKLNRNGSVLLDKNDNPIVQTGKQTITGTFLNDVITGGQGADTINLASSDYATGDRVNSGKGNDTINIKNYGKKVITIANEDGNDVITGTSTAGAETYLNFTEVDVDSVLDAKNNLEYIRSKNNLIIKRTYEVGGVTKTSTTTIKDYFISPTLTPSIYFGDGSDTNVSLYNVLNGFNAGTAGTHLNDTLTGTRKADRITTGSGTDTITAGLGNDIITINGSGSKYIVMNAEDGIDTVNIKTNAYTYLQFKGADIIDDATAKNNLTYEKSGKNDVKITYTDAPAKELTNFSGLYFYNKYGQNELILYTNSTKYSEGSEYFTEVSGTGLYSYENEDGKTVYSTNKTTTVNLNTVYFETCNWMSATDGVGYLTTTPHDGEYYNATLLSGVDKIYAYKNTIAPTYTIGGKQATEIIYTMDSNITPTKYSDLWLKPIHEDWGGGYSEDYYLLVKTKENDDCIKVSDQDALYWYNTVPSYSSDNRIYLDDQGGYLPAFITKDEYDSVYYFDNYHSYITDIDDDSTNGIRKEYTVNDSYFLLRNGGGNEWMKQGDATSIEIGVSDYTQINAIYSSKDEEDNIIYSAIKPANFDAKSISTSVIIKDYLTQQQSVLITNSNNTSSARWLNNILYDIGLNIGNTDSKKAQSLIGSDINDNINGGFANDRITTGSSSSYNRGDIITPGKGNDTVIIDGDGKKTINIANADGNDTIIFTDNNKNTRYDYNTYKKLYLNFDNDAELSYSMKGKDLVINRSYNDGTKIASATTTLKDYFNVDYKYQLATNITINNTAFNPYAHFDNSIIDNSTGRKAQTINGNIFDNTIIGGIGNDVINGYGGSDTLDGINGSDTYVVNYNTNGSKHRLTDKITISDTGDGAKDIDTLRLDVKKKDMALLFNVDKITNEEAYTENDIIVGDNHYSYDNQLMIFADWEYMDGVEIDPNSNKLTSTCGIMADGLEKIVTSDKKTVTLNNIREIAQNVASWLSTAKDGGYDSAAAVFNSGEGNTIINMLATYNPDNAAIKDYINMQ